MKKEFDIRLLFIYHKIMETTRLILRPLEIKDAYDIFRNIHHDPHVLECFLASYYENYDDFDFRKVLTYFKENKHFYYAICLKETDQCIGMIFENHYEKGHCEIGYAIGSAYWNQGYMSEALQKVLEVWLNHEEVDCILAGAFVENGASINVMKKCGMKYSHLIKNEIEWHGNLHDVVYYKKEK